MSERRTVSRVCPFCEATCGLAVETDGTSILSVRGDEYDPFSRGFICPKAYGLKELHADPERLRRPLRRTASGWEEIGWDEAFEDAASHLLAIREKHGPNAIGVYSGNPMVHDLAILYTQVLARALGTRSWFNASAIDTLPKIVETGLLFGGPYPATIPVPDIDRTKYLLVIGANPAVSHGSLMTMPDAPGRLKALVARGGKLVVLDPRRTETAKLATEHHFIRPGTDAPWLLAIVHVLFEEKLVKLGAAEGRVAGLEDVAAAARDLSPESVADVTGIPADVTRRIAREMAAAESAACYGRLGTCVQEFGLLASWGVDLVNVLTGNLDRPGGAMFATPAASVATIASGKPFEFDRWRSRVGAQPEVGSMVPSSTMAEEILTPGDGQVRAMILLMTNPLRSAANSARLERAFESLEYVVALDFYLNETTRHAHLILPTPSPAEQPNYELGLYHLSVRNVTKWSSEVVSPPDGSRDAWEVLLRLAAIFLGAGAMPTKDVDDLVFRQVAAAALEKQRDGRERSPSRPTDGLTVDDIVASVDGGAVGPERTIDLLIRLGPWGDRFGRRPEGLTLAKVKASPHGIDLGPLEPGLDRVLNTKSGRIELAPAQILGDLPRLRARVAAKTNGLLLIGRRLLRTSNSFMHNLPALVKGPDHCTLQMSPADAERLGIASGGRARVTSRTGSVVAPVEVTADLMPGVVSLPHGFGHDADGTRISIAAAHAGVNANAVTDDQLYDVPSGTAVLFGVPVTIAAA